MKKLIFAILASVLVFGITSCNKNEKEPEKRTTNVFTITASDVNENSAKVKVAVEAAELPYYAGVVTEEDYLNKYAEKVENIVVEALGEDKTPADITVKGETEKTYGELVANTKYVAFAVTVNDDGKCEADAKTIQFQTTEPVPPTSDMTFTITKTFVSDEVITVEIAPSVDTDTYYFGISKTSSYKDAQTEVEAYVSNFIANNPDAKKEDALRMVLRKGKLSYSFNGLDAETEYTIYAIGVSADGFYTTPEATLKEKTLVEELTFQLPVLEITSTSAVIYFKPSRNDQVYYGGYVSEDIYFKDCEGSKEGLKTYIDKLLAEKVAASSVKDVLEKECKTGNSDMTVEGLEPDTKYYVFGVAVDENAKCVSTPFIDNFTTKVSQTFNFEFTTVTDTKIEYKITTNDASSTYYTYYLSKVDFDAIGGEEGVIELIKMKGGSIADELRTGTAYVAFEELKAETEYVVFAVGFNEKGVITSELSTASVTTKPAEAEGCTFTIDMVELTSTSAKVRFTPSDLTFSYIRNCIAVEDLDGAPSEETIAQAALAYLQSQVGGYYDTLEKVIRANSWTKVQEKTFIGKSNQISPMVSGKEYVAFAVGFDTEGKQTSKLYYIQFTLPAE